MCSMFVQTPATPPSASKLGRHGKQASVDLDADFFDCIDRSDDSFLREFQESLGLIRLSSGNDKSITDTLEGQLDGSSNGRHAKAPSIHARGASVVDHSLARVSEGAEVVQGLENPGAVPQLQMASSNLSSDEHPDKAVPTSSAIAEIEVTPQQVEQVRAQLNPLDEEPDDAMITRFIRATGGNLPQSVQRLNTTLKWRAKVVPENVVCMACAAKPKSHYMHLCGYDNLSRPIIYSCLANAANKVYLDTYHHMIQTFEMAIKCMPPGVQQWVWVCDFHGFGLADINPKLARAFLDISAEHYPERLGLFIVAGAPSLFSILWKAISPFVDPKTHQKIRFLPCDFTEKKSKMRKEMQHYFSDSLTSWFETEMMQNREKGQAAKKTYNLGSMFKLAQEGKLQPEGKHDLRGHSSLLTVLAANPALMEPQATADQYL